MTAPRRARAAMRSRRPADEAAGDRSPTVDLGILPGLIGFHLRTAQIAVFQNFNRRLAGSGITPPQFGTLVLIEANPGISQSAVASVLRFDRSTLVQIVDRLEDRGLVIRDASARDRRSHALRLTGRGERLLAALKQDVHAHEDAIAAQLGTAERTALIELLVRVQCGADEAAD